MLLKELDMRRFYFYRRKGVYYAKLNTPSGILLSGRSTKTQNRDEALLMVAEWLKNGVPIPIHPSHYLNLTFHHPYKFRWPQSLYRMPLPKYETQYLRQHLARLELYIHAARRQIPAHYGWLRLLLIPQLHLSN
jgi:hypothetical protein